MTERVPCRECGAEILPTTAKATGGICMACKQGIRQDIESSKKYYEAQRQYDPFKELWKSLVHRIYKTKEGLHGLSPAERTYYCVLVLEGEVYNGGMHQYFSNSSGDDYKATIDGLLELKAFKALLLLTEAKNLLFEGDVPEDPAARNEAIKDYEDSGSPPPAWVQELERIDQGFWDDPDGLGERLEAFAREHGLVQPFEKIP